jgi:hypothetical protein
MGPSQERARPSCARRGALVSHSLWIASDREGWVRAHTPVCRKVLRDLTTRVISTPAPAPLRDGAGSTPTRESPCLSAQLGCGSRCCHRARRATSCSGPVTDFHTGRLSVEGVGEARSIGTHQVRELTVRRKEGPLLTSLARGDASSKLVEAYRLHPNAIKPWPGRPGVLAFR